MIVKDGKAIYSLPERVNENSRRIKELEKHNPMFLHSLLIEGDTVKDIQCSMLFFSDSATPISSVDELRAIVEQQGRLPVSGWNDSDALAACYIWINDQSENLEIVFGVPSNTNIYELDDNDDYTDSVVNI